MTGCEWCPWHRAAQGTAPSWAGGSPSAKVKMLLPSSQHCTWEWQWLPGGKDTEASLILCNSCAHRDVLTLSHADGSRCQAQLPYGTEINCQPVLNSHSPILARQGTCPGLHTHCLSPALLCLPSSSFVIYPAQVLKNEIFSTWGLSLPCCSNNGFVLLPLISIAIPCPLTLEVQTSWLENTVRVEYKHKHSKLIKKRDFFLKTFLGGKCRGESKMSLHLCYVSPHQPYSPGDLHRHKEEGTSSPGMSRTSHQAGRVTAHNRESLSHGHNSELRSSLKYTVNFISRLIICFFLLQCKFLIIERCSWETSEKRSSLFLYYYPKQHLEPKAAPNCLQVSQR